MPLDNLKVVMSVKDESMLPVKLGKMNHVTTLEYLLSLELSIHAMSSCLTCVVNASNRHFIAPPLQLQSLCKGFSNIT